MNFRLPHTRVTFPSLLTATTDSTDNNENGTTGSTNTTDSGDNMEEKDPTIAYAMFQQRVTHYIHNAYWYVPSTDR
jgi:hypothetical protein